MLESKLERSRAVETSPEVCLILGQMLINRSLDFQSSKCLPLMPIKEGLIKVILSAPHEMCFKALHIETSLDK